MQTLVTLELAVNHHTVIDRMMLIFTITEHSQSLSNGYRHRTLHGKTGLTLVRAHGRLRLR